MAPAATAGTLFAVVTLAVIRHGTAGLDVAGHGWALSHRGGVVARAAAWVTHGGEFGLVVPAVLLAGLGTPGGWWQRTRTALLMSAVLGGGALVRLELAGLVAWAVTGRVTRPWLRTSVWAVAGMYAIAVGWSRVWLGVHWPADVLGGWLFAVTWLAVARLVAARWTSPPAGHGPDDHGSAGA